MKVIEKIWSELKIEKEIGRGAYGNVYRCVDTKTDEYSAVKVISVPSAENGLVEYGTDRLSYEETQAYYKEIADDMVKEIEILKSLKGTDNIVEIYDAKVAEKEYGVGWYILIKMELLTEFKTYSAKKDFTEADVLKLGADLCSALSVCHKAKILHRDIKPENIFVDSEGNYKLGDFGVAKQMEKTQGSMSIKGTFNYMSPEVFGGRKCDNRADLYSLAIVMYKLLNGNRMPFIDKNKDTVRYSERQSAFEKRMHGDNIPPISGISSELNRVILKACAFNPVDRYRSAEEFASQIQQILNGQKIKKSIKKSLVKKIVVSIAVVSMLSAAGAFVCYNATKLGIDEGNPDYKSPEYITVEKEADAISAHRVNDTYIHYDGNEVYLLGERVEKVADTQSDNVYFDGEKVYYSSFEPYNYWGYKYKNTIHITGEEDKVCFGQYAISNILYCKDEIIYFEGVSDDEEKWLCCPEQSNYGGSYTIKPIVEIYEYLSIYGDYLIFSESETTIKYLVLTDLNKDPETLTESRIGGDKTIFYKEGSVFLLEESSDNNIVFAKYDVEKGGKKHERINLTKLGVSSISMIDALNDKYVLVHDDNGAMSIITYGEKVKIKPVYKYHLDKYIGDDFKVFVDSEISQGIILSVEKENVVYLYSIKENGKLALIGKNEELSESVIRDNGLIYEFDKEREFFKKYEIG